MRKLFVLAMKPLTDSLSRHPYLAMLYGVFAGGIAVGVGLEDHWLFPGALLEVVLFLAAVTLVDVDIRRAGVVLALLISIVAAPAAEKQSAQPPPPQNLGSPCVWKAAAAVVVAVGGYVCVKLAKFCQKHFPKKRELPPDTNEVWLARSPFSLDSDCAAAALNFGPLGSCLPDDPCYSDGEGEGGSALVQSGRSGVATVLEITLARAPDGRSAFSHRFAVEAGSEGLQNWEEFQGEVARDHGVFLTGQCCENFHSLNGSPIPESESVIRCDPGQAIRVVGGLPYLVSVDCSRDLRFWDRLLSIEVPAGSTLRVEDATRKAVVFYRWSAVPAW